MLPSFVLAAASDPGLVDACGPKGQQSWLCSTVYRITGDSHAVQGDGEINGTAIEASLSPVLQFVVHKGAGRAMKWPRAEDDANWYVMGMDVDLDAALKQAAEETIAFLQREKGLSPADAYSLASIAVNYVVAEAVDHVQMVYGAIPKRIFTRP